MVDEAIELCEEILNKLDDMPDTKKAQDFADSVREKTTGILEWILDNDYVTQKQLRSLENMCDGIDAWLD